jgi:hypothetical protein
VATATPHLGLGDDRVRLADPQVGLRLPDVQFDEQVAGTHLLADVHPHRGNRPGHLRPDRDVAGAAGLGRRLDHPDPGHRVPERARRRLPGRWRVRIRPLDADGVDHGEDQQPRREAGENVLQRHGFDGHGGSLKR